MVLVHSTVADHERRGFGPLDEQALVTVLLGEGLAKGSPDDLEGTTRLPREPSGVALLLFGW